MLFLVLVCVLATAARADIAPSGPSLPEPPGAEVRERAARIVGATLVDGKALKVLEDLSDRVGGRMTGTASYGKAVEWTQAQLRAAGLTDVRLEPFTMAAGWQRGGARGRIVAPFDRPLHLDSEGWSPPTPKGGVRAQLVVIKDTSPEALAKLIPTLRGKIVLVADGGPPKKGYKTYVSLLKQLGQLRDAGVAILLMPSRGAINNVISTGSIEWDGKLEQLPIATVGVEDSKLLERTAEHGAVTLEIDLPNRVTGATKAMSVVGELRGSERPNEWILLGAHLDSWDLATGSQDNGAGVAEVLEAARVLAATGPHKRTIRFALWGGEEQGLVGSLAYAQAHEAELGTCVAVLNTDNGAGHPKGWKVEGRRDVFVALKPISKSLLAALGADQINMSLDFDTDHASFVLHGVPALDMLVDDGDYNEVHHKPADTVDKIVEHNLALGAAVLAVTAEALADSTAPFAPRLEHKDVAEILKEDDLDQYLISVGLWK